MEGGEDLADVLETPLHGELIFPVELFFAGLRGSVDKDRALRRIEPEADHAAGAAGVWLVDGVIGGALREGLSGIEGGIFHGGVLVGVRTQDFTQNSTKQEKYVQMNILFFGVGLRSFETQRLRDLRIESWPIPLQGSGSGE